MMHSATHQNWWARLLAHHVNCCQPANWLGYINACSGCNASHRYTHAHCTHTVYFTMHSSSTMPGMYAMSQHGCHQEQITPCCTQELQGFRHYRSHHLRGVREVLKSELHTEGMSQE
jgi:hypothetical protein